MIRKEYRLINDALNVLLAEKRLKRDRFVSMTSRRESHFNWKKRVQVHNKHTVGTEVW